MAYIYSGDVVAQQLFDPAKYRSPLDGAVLDSILRNTKPSTSVRYPGDSLPASIVGAYTTNYDKKVQAYLSFGRFKHSDSVPSNVSTDEYPTNNPDDENYVAPHPDIKTEIEALLGEEVRITWYLFGYPEDQFLVRNFMLEDPTNEFILYNRQTTHNVSNRFEERSTGKQYLPSGYSHIGTNITMTAEEIEYGLDPESGFYVWLPRGNFKTWVLDLTLINSTLPNDIVHQVIYETVTTRDTGFWFYNETQDPGGVLYPNIFGSVDYVDYGSESYPFAMIIEEGKQVIKGHLGEDYKTQTEDLLGKIDLDLATLMDALDGDGGPGEGDVNEDIKDAFVTYSANFDSDENGSLQYIYEHFRQYYSTATTRMDDAHAFWYANRGQSDWRNKFTLGGQFLFFNNRVQFTIRFRWMSLKIRSGNVNDAFTTRPSDTYLNDVTYNGTSIDANNNGNTTLIWPNGDPNPADTPVKVGEIKKFIFEGSEYAADTDDPQSINDHLYIMRKQLTGGASPTYVEMVVMGLSHDTRLTNPGGDFGTAGEVLHIVNRITETDNGKFFMPVSVQVLDNFNSLIRSEVLYQSLTIVISLYNETKLPWYADEALMLAIRIVLTIVTFGSSEGFIEVLFQLVQQYAVQVIVTEVLKFVVDLIGGEAALILAAIAVAVAAFSGGGSDAFKGLFDLLNAEQLMNAATLIVDAVQAQINDDFLELQEDIEAQEEVEEERKEELDDLLAQLGPSTTVDMVDIVVRQPLPDFYEKPGDFFNRTVHVTNPGVLSLDTIDSYVANNLILPRLDDNT